jgi:cytochrome b6-f complex iron-sulfur subunit
MNDEVEEAAVEENGEGERINRREFLYYLWGFTITAASLGVTGATIWYAYPRIPEGEFGGTFTIPLGQIPPEDTRPKEFPEGRFWLVNIGPESVADPRQPEEYPLREGIRAIYKVCTHLGCLYKWTQPTDRFECPCHGSKFLKTGVRIDGPARRNLDSFFVEVVDAEGNVLTTSEPTMDGREAQPVQIPPEAAALRIDTSRTVRGAPNSQPGGGM